MDLISRIPKVTVNEEIGEFEVSDDPESFTKLDVTNVPICISLAKVQGDYLITHVRSEALTLWTQH